MKLAAALALTLATAAMAHHQSSNKPNGVMSRADEPDHREMCSMSRKDSDKCGGKKISGMKSFKKCKNKQGKCCAKNSDGTGAMDVSKGGDRGDCGFCFVELCRGGA
ncbi:hypothetical protein CP532_6173 [Ophiocordyceps camponoti-leonardi (nom. inval.)]|nr:hypothetical protein CP532_6173 [Ophiocordyceps camponoti-leonardi (nom. inval.)]